MTALRGLDAGISVFGQGLVIIGVVGLVCVVFAAWLDMRSR